MSLRSKNKSIFDCAFQPDPNAKQNMNPIYTAPPTKIKSVVNGKLYTLGQTGINQFPIVHVWGM
jgi:hypothetical protein